MTTEHKPLAFYVGDTWEIQCTCHGDAGDPLDLTGATIVWTLYRADGTVLKTKSLGAGVEVFGNPVNGQCVISIDAAESAGIPLGAYFDQLRVTADGEVSTQAVGGVFVVGPGIPAGGTTTRIEMSGTSFTMTDYENINHAIATGARSVSIGNESVSYQSLVDMMRVKYLIAVDLGLIPTRPSTVLVSHERGYFPAGDRE